MEDIPPQDLVMTLLGAYPRDRAAGVWARGLVALLGEFGCSEGTARVALTRMVQRGLLDTQRSGRLARYRPTPRTQEALDEGDQRIFRFGESRSAKVNWTVVWHAIPDSRRDARQRLAARLRFLGFGQVQDGLWLAARDRAREVDAVLVELQVREHASVLLGKPDGDVGAMVAKAWDFAELKTRYRRFVRTYEGCDPAALTERQAFRTRTLLVHEFRQYPLLDPELPRSAAPRSPGRDSAVRLFHELYPALAPAAQRYFDEVITP